MNRYLIVLVDHSGGTYAIQSIAKYVTDTLEEAEGAVSLMNEVMNYSQNKGDDGEWEGTHFKVQEVEVWGASA